MEIIWMLLREVLIMPDVHLWRWAECLHNQIRENVVCSAWETSHGLFGWKIVYNTIFAHFKLDSFIICNKAEIYMFVCRKGVAGRNGRFIIWYEEFLYLIKPVVVVVLSLKKRLMILRLSVPLISEVQAESFY